MKHRRPTDLVGRWALPSGQEFRIEGEYRRGLMTCRAAGSARPYLVSVTDLNRVLDAPGARYLGRIK